MARTNFTADPGRPSVNQGYDVVAPHRFTGGENCTLLDMGTNEKIDLWVYELQTDLTLEGKTAQSSKTRSFFPRNFAQQSYQFSGQAPNQEHYGTLAEFIHAHQRNAINTGKLARLWLRSTPKGYDVKGVKGKHRPIMALGYVRSFKRTHNRHEYAPNYKFEFVVARQLDSGVFPKGDPAIVHTMNKSWETIVEERRKGGSFVAYEEDRNAQVGDYDFWDLAKDLAEGGKNLVDAIDDVTSDVLDLFR